MDGSLLRGINPLGNCVAYVPSVKMIGTLWQSRFVLWPPADLLRDQDRTVQSDYA